MLGDDRMEDRIWIGRGGRTGTRWRLKRRLIGLQGTQGRIEHGRVEVLENTIQKREGTGGIVTGISDFAGNELERKSGYKICADLGNCDQYGYDKKKTIAFEIAI